MSAIDPFLDWQFLEGVVNFYSIGMAEAAFFLVFVGATFMALYQSTGSVMLPVVVLIVLAPMLAAVVPAVGIQFVTIVLLVMSSIGGYWLLQSLND